MAEGAGIMRDEGRTGRDCVPVWEMTLCQRHLDNVWNTVNPVWQTCLSGTQEASLTNGQQSKVQLSSSTKTSFIMLILGFVECLKEANLFLSWELEAVFQTCCISWLVFNLFLFLFRCFWPAWAVPPGLTAVEIWALQRKKASLPRDGSN